MGGLRFFSDDAFNGTVTKKIRVPMSKLEEEIKAISSGVEEMK